MTDRDDKGKMEDPANVIHNDLPLDPMTTCSRNAEETCSFGEYEVWPTEEQQNNITENRTESAHTDTDYVVTNPSAALSQA